jgi:hypothetical protein
VYINIFLQILSFNAPNFSPPPGDQVIGDEERLTGKGKTQRRTKL